MLSFTRKRNNMMNFVDEEKYEYLYSSDQVLPTVCAKKFDLNEFQINRSSYADSLNSENRKLLHQILSHYLHIIQSLYGRDFYDHLPKIMHDLLYSFKILSFNNQSQFYIHTADKYYLELIKNPRRYVCENAYFYIKKVRVLHSYDIEERLTICRSPTSKPRMLKQLAFEIYINSKQWINTSTLDLIEYNFKDLIFASNLSGTYTFYDILVIKFVFQYFLKRNDTNFPVFSLICKCTYGLKNKKHVTYDPKLIDFRLSKNACVLCNAAESKILKTYLGKENKNICYCTEENK